MLLLSGLGLKRLEEEAGEEVREEAKGKSLVSK